MRTLPSRLGGIIDVITPIIMAILFLLVMISTTGCVGHIGRYGTPVSPETRLRQDMLYGVPASRLPPDLVRRSETRFSNLDGSYQYSHSQGTDSSVSPYGGWYQRTYNDTYESYTPRWYRGYRGWSY